MLLQNSPTCILDSPCIIVCQQVFRELRALWRTDATEPPETPGSPERPAGRVGLGTMAPLGSVTHRPARAPRWPGNPPTPRTIRRCSVAPSAPPHTPRRTRKESMCLLVLNNGKMSCQRRSCLSHPSYLKIGFMVGRGEWGETRRHEREQHVA